MLLSVRSMSKYPWGETTWDDAQIQLSIQRKGIDLSQLSHRPFQHGGIITCRLSLFSSAARPHYPFLYPHEDHLRRAATMSLEPLFPCPCLERVEDQTLQRLNRQWSIASIGTQWGHALSLEMFLLVV